MFTDKQKDTFWSKVEKTNYCWNWIGGLDKHGYGKAKCGGTTYIAHRLAWYMTHGLTTRLLRHKCDNRKCVNPAHLFEADAVEPFVKRDKAAVVLDYDQARAMRLRRLKLKRTIRELADEYGVTTRTVRDVLNRKTWK